MNVGIILFILFTVTILMENISDGNEMKVKYKLFISRIIKIYMTLVYFGTESVIHKINWK